jgi:hypothetical protein
MSHRFVFKKVLKSIPCQQRCRLPQAESAVFFRLPTDYRCLAPMLIRYFLDFQALLGAVPSCFGEQCVRVGNGLKPNR